MPAVADAAAAGFPGQAPGAPGAWRIWSMTTVVAPIAGPLLGGCAFATTYGLAVDFLHQRPVRHAGRLLLVAGMQLVGNREDAHEEAVRLPIDFGRSGAPRSSGSAPLQITLDKGKELDWFASPMIVGLTDRGGGRLHAAFMIWELTSTKTPSWQSESVPPTGVSPLPAIGDGAGVRSLSSLRQWCWCRCGCRPTLATPPTWSPGRADRLGRGAGGSVSRPSSARLVAQVRSSRHGDLVRQSAWIGADDGCGAAGFHLRDVGFQQPDPGRSLAAGPRRAVLLHSADGTLGTAVASARRGGERSRVDQLRADDRRRLRHVSITTTAWEDAGERVRSNLVQLLNQGRQRHR